MGTTEKKVADTLMGREFASPEERLKVASSIMGELKRLSGTKFGNDNGDVALFSTGVKVVSIIPAYTLNQAGVDDAIERFNALLEEFLIKRKKFLEKAVIEVLEGRFSVGEKNYVAEFWDESLNKSSGEYVYGE